MAEVTGESAEVLLSKAKILHAMRGAIVQDLLAKVGLAIRGSAGDFLLRSPDALGQAEL